MIKIGQAIIELLRNFPCGAIIIDKESGKIAFVNDFFVNLLGFNPEGISFEEYSLKMAKARQLDNGPFLYEQLPLVKALLFGKSAQNEEIVIKTLDQMEVTLLVNAKPLINQSGEIEGSIGIFQDITPMKKAEQQLLDVKDYLRKRVEELENLMDILPASIWISYDPLCKNMFGNKAARILYEVGNDENVSAGPADLSSNGNNSRRFFSEGRELKSHELPMQKAVSENVEVTNSEIEVLLPSGKRRYVIGNAKPLLNNDGSVRGAIGAFVDITEQKHALQELEKCNKYLNELVDDRTNKLREAERLAAIGQTAGMVGHDIRNPLQAIAGDAYLIKNYITCIEKADLRDEALECLNEIEKNVSYINKIVADLQDYAKPLHPQLSTVDISEVINDVIRNAYIPNKIRIQIVPTTTVKLKTDPTFLRRIISNLLNNAIQAMPEGGHLKLSYSLEGTRFVISISDTGIGIPEEVKLRLFTPMMTTKSKGQGLGLAVVKRLVEALGGIITFESKEGEGTKFVIDLPFSSA